MLNTYIHTNSTLLCVQRRSKPAWQQNPPSFKLLSEPPSTSPPHESAQNDTTHFMDGHPPPLEPYPPSSIGKIPIYKYICAMVCDNIYFILFSFILMITCMYVVCLHCVGSRGHVIVPKHCARRQSGWLHYVRIYTSLSVVCVVLE